jgi:DNA-binding MarR family transcriptional regulator
MASTANLASSTDLPLDSEQAPELDPDRAMQLLEQIERDPDINQVSLADQLGVAVGKVNWLLKHLVAKGYVKVKRLKRRKLRYIITPEGIALRARLTINYIDHSMRLYRRVRAQVSEQLQTIQQAGYNQVVLDGEGDIADICRLTCLEQGIAVIEVTSSSDTPEENSHLPMLEVNGTIVFLSMDNKGVNILPSERLLLRSTLPDERGISK